jgi:hypothetical protein
VIGAWEGAESPSLGPDGWGFVWPAHIVTEWLVFKVTTHKPGTGQNRTDLANPSHLTLAIGPYAGRERSRNFGFGARDSPGITFSHIYNKGVHPL